MAKRSVFIVGDNRIKTINIEFEWNGGFALSQSRKNIIELHNEYRRIYDNNAKLLEVSSKSEDELGVRLSAFNLLMYVSSLNKSVPVECVFQAGKVFENGGPYLDLLEKSPRDAKRDDRLGNSGKLLAFEFEGERFPLEPKTYFYDYIYIKALKENPELADRLLEYDGFTDIVFNPEKSINCQAKACAKYVAERKKR